MTRDLFETLELLSSPLPQNDHFKAEYLRSLFWQKIARSQATGKDGTRVDRFSENLADETLLIDRKIRNQTYSFTTYKERFIFRGTDRPPRQISIPTVRDRLVLRAICTVLHTYIPKSLGASPHTQIKRISEAIAEIGPDHSFVRVDVKDFFPSVGHERLKKELAHHSINQQIQDLCITATKNPTGASSELSKKGIPQGLSISGALAAIFMLRFDMLQKLRNPNFYRYVDDILLITPNSSAQSELNRVKRALNSRGLKVHPLGTTGKTEIKRIEDGIDFLGYNITPDKISVRKSSFDRMFRNVLKVLTDFKYRRNIERTIFRLNLKISGCRVDEKRRGWIMFFSQTGDTSQLAFLDRFVRQQLQRVGFPIERLSEIKTFIKSYHEIRFKRDSTLYIPNFDNFSTAQQSEVIAALTGEPIEIVLTQDIETIELRFQRLVSKEIQNLEQDIGSHS